MNEKGRSGWLLAILTAILMTPVAVAVQIAEDGRHPPGRDWTLFGGSWTNARHSTLSQINTQTVKGLGGAWTMKFENNASTRATPIVKDGVTWTRNIGYEIQKTGQAVSGSPSYANGVVYAGLANGDWAFRGKAVALDANTGNQLWEFYTIPGPGEAGHDTWPSASDPKYGD